MNDEQEVGGAPGVPREAREPETQRVVDLVCPWCGDRLNVLKPAGGCLIAEKHGYGWHAACADAAEAVDEQVADLATLRQQLAEWQIAITPCEVHTPDLWEGDGTCVICEGHRIHDALTALRAQRDRLCEVEQEMRDRVAEKSIGPVHAAQQAETSHWVDRLAVVLTDAAQEDR